ncbi:MAG TPA: glycosyltransferase family 39 protein [Solirubrobacteraceae bacterium]|nr:glycosyltransferase family 39 protein [Solirubrobacteraceae bacterium]
MSAPAWVATGVVTAFIAVTCWWLALDRGIPIYDVGNQLETARGYYNMLAAGRLLGPFEHVGVYPILAHMVGAVAMLVGGANVAAPTIAENIVFVPLLAVGCYQTGRLLFGPLAGMLAVLCALGSPLLISMFHVFLLDAPLAALVAVATWLVLASEDFSRVPMAAAAGMAVGLGINVKVQFGLFLAGLVLVVVVHGGWRNRRGLAAFSALAGLIGAPWYIVHATVLPKMLDLASSGPGTPVGNIPPTWSLVNFGWYFWSVLNSQLLAPLFALALAGAIWTVTATIRNDDRRPVRVEFLSGGFAAWLALTLTPHHDIRYGLPLLPLVAVLATGWIACLARGPRLAMSAVLVVAVAANTLGIDFGVGTQAEVALVRAPPTTEQAPDRLVLLSTSGFLASAPSRDGDVPGLLRALRRAGVRRVTWSTAESELPDFSTAGLLLLARMAGLSPAPSKQIQPSLHMNVATLIHEPAGTRSSAACTRLSDGSAVWVARYDAATGRPALYCPSPRPRFYDLGFFAHPRR